MNHANPGNYPDPMPPMGDSCPAPQVMGNRGPRYRVVGGSQSAHCCFEATVVDTYQSQPVCECFSVADANLVTNALNRQCPSEGIAKFLELRELKEYAAGDQQGAPPLSLLADAVSEIENLRGQAETAQTPNIAELKTMLAHIAKDLEDELKTGGQNPLRYDPQEIREAL